MDLVNEHFLLGACESCLSVASAEGQISRDIRIDSDVCRVLVQSSKGDRAEVDEGMRVVCALHTVA